MTTKTNLKTSKYVHRPPKEYTWASELRWYYENFHWFHFTFLVAAVLPLVRIAQHVPLRFETGLMSAGFLTVGGVSMTAGACFAFSSRPVIDFEQATIGFGLTSRTKHALP